MRMTNEDYAAEVKSIRRIGPSRVVCEIRDGQVAYGGTPEQARNEYDLEVSGVLLRSDGWSLGYSGKLGHKDAARRLWAGDWVAEMDTVEGTLPNLVGLPGLEPEWNK